MTPARRTQHGVLQLARELELPRLRLGGGLRRLRGTLRVLVVGDADGTVGFQFLETFAVRLGLLRVRVRRAELLIGSLHGEPVVIVVEHGQHVAFAHDVAHVHATLHDLAADAEGLVDLVTRLHGADVAMRLARFAVANLDGQAAVPRGGSWLHAVSAAAGSATTAAGR
jgi:hypothetical protein